ncbi:MAG: hypothetical protein Q9225_001735 [Loekoesia sp. 1 TL-2023]
MSSAERRQQRQDGTSEKDERVLQSAALTLQEDKDFRSRAMELLHKKPDAVKTSLAELERQIQPYQSVRREASVFLKAADDAHEQWDEKGRSGTSRLGRGMQKFVSNFVDFVRAYAGFVDLIRQSNGLYAEAAYGTLSLFFMAAINKSENDSKFAGTLEELRNSFPRMKLAEDIYSQDSVKQRVSKVYREVIIFARESFKYFLKKPSHRVVKAIVSPASLGVDRTIEKLHSCLAEVNAEIGILLHQRVHDIAKLSKDISSKNINLLTEVKVLQTKNDELFTQNNELLHQVRSMKEDAARETLNKDDENLKDFYRTLGDISPKFSDCQLCKTNLADIFPRAFGADESSLDWSGKYVQMTPEYLEGQPSLKVKQVIQCAPGFHLRVSTSSKPYPQKPRG